MSIYKRLRRRIEDLGISHKFVLICALTSVITLGMLFSFTLYRDSQLYKQRKLSALESVSEIMASNLVAALRFQDLERADQYLGSLSHQSDIVQAILFNSAGKPFASFYRQEALPLLELGDLLGWRFEDETAIYAEAVMLNDQRIGTLVVAAETKSIQAAFAQTAAVSLTLLLVGTAISILLANRLKQIIVEPIQDLEKVAKGVRDAEDYRARAVKSYNDEVGSLVESFNAMLDRIGDRDSSLREINANLERLVDQRTQDLKTQNLALESAMQEAKSASIAKSEFLATTSHELRTPLNPIIGYVEKLQRENPNSPYAQEFELINRSARQLLRLIEDVLDFSRIESGTLRLQEDDIDLQRLCAEITTLLKPQADRKKLKLINSYSESEEISNKRLLVCIDEGRIRQVVQNLANNALKFTNEGSISIETEVQLIDTLSATVTLKVSDTGVGIAEEDLAKLYKPFSQIDSSWRREFGGMGLGLAI